MQRSLYRDHQPCSARPVALGCRGPPALAAAVPVQVPAVGCRLDCLQLLPCPGVLILEVSRGPLTSLFPSGSLRLPLPWACPSLAPPPPPLFLRSCCLGTFLWRRVWGGPFEIRPGQWGQGRGREGGVVTDILCCPLVVSSALQAAGVELG